jgi:diguanylate cyclase (GGDEF)-like protein
MQDVATVAKGRSSIPAPASLLAIQIVQAAVRPNITVNELVAVCQNDPAFVARLFASVNNVSFGLNRRVNTVQHGVSLLGVRGVRNLALATCVTEMAPVGKDGDILLAVSLRRAVAAKLVATKLAKPAAEDYFALGMLLELGLLVSARENLAAAANIARAPANTRVLLERATGLEDHAHRGGRLAKSWNLDLEMVRAIAHHHDRNPPTTDFGTVAWLAERLAAVFEGGDVSRNRVDAIEAGARLRISAKDIDELLRVLPTQVAEAARDLKRKIEVQVDIEVLLRDANKALVDVNRSYVDLVQRLEELVSEKERIADELKSATNDLTTLALADRLTGLNNRRSFDDLLIRDLARADRQKTVVSVISVQADSFKRINDTYGHSAGDLVLEAIAEVLRASVRASDVVARIGGEEFAIILPQTDAQNAVVVAERVRSSMAARVFAGPKSTTFQVTVSLGIAMTQGPGCRTHATALMDAADGALQAAKLAGRNCIHIGTI